jgi:hypothetical protein
MNSLKPHYLILRNTKHQKANYECLEYLLFPYFMKPEFHDRLSLDPTLSHFHPVHSFTFYFSKIHLNTILTSMRRSTKWPLSLVVACKNFVCTFRSLATINQHRIYKYLRTHIQYIDNFKCDL